MFLLVEIMINPVGEFPLNDDWAYSLSVDHYITNNEIQFSFWQAIPALPQIFIGIICCKLFGFSFTVLRIISLVCLFIMIFLMDCQMLAFQVDRLKRLIVLLVFTFNPLTLSLANSFLPDTLQLFLSFIAFLFAIGFFIKNEMKNYLLFILFSVLATLNRQSAITVPVIFGILFFLESPKNIRNVIASVIPFLISFTALVIFEQIETGYHKLPGNYGLQFNNIINKVTHPSFEIIKSTGYYFITSTVCLGLFILPLTISNIRQHYLFVKNSTPAKAAFVLYFALIIVKLLFSGNVFPFVGNMFYHLGTGPVILTGFNTDEQTDLSLPAKMIWAILNILGGISFFASVTMIAAKQKKSKRTTLFFLLLMVFYLLPICINYANDRYLLYLLPFYFLAYILCCEIRVNRLLFFISFMPLFYFSLAGTHDYMDINRARWKATDHLTKQLKISPGQIDGGFEFNAWYLSGTNNYLPTHRGRWWWIQNDEFIISPFARTGYTVESTHEVSSWISFNFKKIYVLQKTNKLADS